MEKRWIDKEGRLRLEHDENYQMLYRVPLDEVFIISDSWDIDIAGRLIVLGYNLDLKATIEYGLKECPYGTPGHDQADALITVMDRFFTLAKAAIAIGVIKEHDTPANWIKWAKSKGYSIAHLVKAPAQAETQNNSPSNKLDWKDQARLIADELFDKDTKLNCRRTLDDYAELVMNEMQKREIHGPRGRYDNPQTIKREALSGEKWWQIKKK